MRPSVPVWMLVFAVPLLAGCVDDPTPYFGEDAADCTFSTTGRNPFLILEPGWVLRLEGTEDGEALSMAIVVTNDTRVVNGTETRVVLEEEKENGELIEKSWNFLAYCEETGSVFYFGEEVDDYEDGELKGHHGEWLAGEKGARPSVIMPGAPEVGLEHFMEYSPGRAMDRAEVVSLDETVATPAGTFTDAMKVKETTELEPGEVEYKWYARDVGVIVDESLRLVSYGSEW